MSSSYNFGLSLETELVMISNFAEIVSSRAFILITFFALAFLLCLSRWISVDLYWIFGHSKLSFYHSAEDVQLTLRSGSKRHLSDFCKEVLPPCWLNPLLFNGHVQTIWTAIRHRSPQVYYKRKVFECEDIKYQGTFDVDFVVHTRPPADPSLPERTSYYSEEELKAIGSQDAKPMLVVLHGLAGGSSEAYLREVIAPLVRNREWAACVVNSRGCAGSKLTSGILYNARATWDIRQVVKWLKEKYPHRPLFGLGFSIGANMLTNYIGEEGSGCMLKAALVCSNPWNLDASALALQRSWLGMEVYSKAMGSSMRKLVEENQEEVLSYTRVDVHEVRKITYLHEFDRVIQCPTYGYPTEEAYYRDASCVDSLLAVEIPFLALNAKDDPICPDEAVPYCAFQSHPCAVLCMTSKGGHLGWFQSGGDRWFAKAAVKFFNGIARDVALDSIARKNFPFDKTSRFRPMKRRIT